MTAALVENLERHLPSIEEAEPEHRVYAELVDRLKPAADELCALLEARAPEHEQMLAAMQRA